MPDATPAEPPAPSSAAQLSAEPAAAPARRRRREKTLLWHTIAAILLPPLTVMARYHVVDGHKLPRTGAFILAPNHYSEIDPVIMGRYMWKLGRVPRFLAKASVFRVRCSGPFCAGRGRFRSSARGGGGRMLRSRRRSSSSIASSR